jgi:hypothetical protein
LEQPLDDAELIYRVAESIWQENWPPGQPMRLIGVGVTGLSECEQRQLRFGF